MMRTKTRRMWRMAALLLAVGVSGTARAEWREARTAHFIIQSDESEASLTERAQRLEALHWLMRTATAADDRSNALPVRIFVVPTTTALHRAMTAPSPRVAGFYRGGNEGAVAAIARDKGDFANVALYHEYAHHFMLQYMRGHFPPWYVEGFAEVMGSTSFDRAGGIDFGRTPQHRAYELRSTTLAPLSLMFAPRNPGAPRAGEAGYGQYWLVTHYLTFAPERRGQLADFLTRLSRGQSATEAYAAFTGGIEQLDRDVRQYLRANRFGYQTVPLPADVTSIAPAVRVLGRDEVDLMPVQLQLERRLPPSAMAETLERAAALATRYPRSIAVARLNARALLEARRWADAERAADAALALAPDDVRASTYKALAQLRQIGPVGGDPAKLAAARTARALIVRANRRDTEDMVPLFAFWDSFKITRETPPPSALEALYKASDLVPTWTQLRMELGMMLALQRRHDDARSVLFALAYAPHPSAAQRLALRLLDWVELGATGAAPRSDAQTEGESDADEPPAIAA